MPAALGAKLGRKPGDIAILYKDSSGGDIAAHAATSAGRPFVRADNAAPYKKVALTSWIEDCSAWCAGGWRRADPKLEGLIDRWGRFYARSISEQGRRDNAIALTDFLWNQRSTTDAADFVGALKAHLLDELLACQPSLGDQAPEVSKLAQALKAGGALAGFTTSELGRQDGSPDHLNLLTFHSSKGSEFDVVIMLGLDQGALPWRNASPGQLADDRRVFYVGLTRARNAVHLLYSGWTQTPWGARAFGRSMFVDELQTKLIDAELAEARRQQ